MQRLRVNRSKAPLKSCPHCGRACARPGAAADEGQRRWLTVTFTDVVGSTELSRRLDPEDYGDMMLRYQNLCGEVVERRGGHLASYAGDGLLALFGWPTSHEREPTLPCLPPLTSSQRAPRPQRLPRGHTTAVRLSLRIGAHSGLAVVGKLGRSGRVDTSVFGDIGNVAVRVSSTRPRWTRSW